MPTYRNPDTRDGDPEAVVAAVLAATYPALVLAGLTVEVLMAEPARDKNGEPKGRPLKLHGYPCAAVIKVNSHLDRVEGKRDCTIRLDAIEWQTLDDGERAALIDHELAHVELILDKDGAVKLDDCSRPRIRLRNHDYEVGGFESVAKRHGEASYEMKHARQLTDDFGQTLFPWMRS